MSDITMDAPVASDTGVATEVSEGLDTSTPSAEPSFAPEASGQEPSAESAPAEDYVFELDEIGGVTLDEAKKGYLRQADYTRKTQELAQMRQALQQAEAIQAALQRDPAATLQVLAESFGVALGPQDTQDPYADLDPDEARVARLEADLRATQARLQQQDVEARINNELAELHERHGEFDESKLFTIAVEQRVDLSTAHRLMEYDRIQAELEAAKAKEAEEAKRTEAKRSQAAVTHTASSSRASSAAPTGSAEQPASFRDAYLAAKRQLGL